MAQIEFTGLTRNWKPFATIVGTVDADTTYHIQNRGFDTLVLLEADSEPTKLRVRTSMIFGAR